jgi:hypothetical protein
MYLFVGAGEGRNIVVRQMCRQGVFELASINRGGQHLTETGADGDYSGLDQKVRIPVLVVIRADDQYSRHLRAKRLDGIEKDEAGF